MKNKIEKQKTEIGKNTPALEAKKLCMTYDLSENPTPVLFDITFSVMPGEFVAIMGPSGSGKSTLLHIMGFLDSHTGGVFKFNGKSMEDCDEKEIARIRNQEMGFVFQAFINSSIACCKSATLAKLPRRIACSLNSRNQRSTKFSQLELVGTKWHTNRGCFFSQAFTCGSL